MFGDLTGLPAQGSVYETYRDSAAFDFRTLER